MDDKNNMSAQEEPLPAGLSDASIPDFNVELEYVPDPLIPDGVYNGLITDLKYDTGFHALQWEVALQNNLGICCDDGSTPVDGERLVFSNWLPVPGDEAALSKKGI